MLLIDYKKTNRLSFQDLATLFHTTKASIWFWCQGTRLPKLAKLKLIQKKTDNQCTVEEMIAFYHHQKLKK